MKWFRIAFLFRSLSWAVGCCLLSLAYVFSCVWLRVLRRLVAAAAVIWSDVLDSLLIVIIVYSWYCHKQMHVYVRWCSRSSFFSFILLFIILNCVQFNNISEWLWWGEIICYIHFALWFDSFASEEWCSSEQLVSPVPFYLKSFTQPKINNFLYRWDLERRLNEKRKCKVLL